MKRINNLKMTVNVLAILMSIFCTQAFAQLSPVGMEARVITFFKGDSVKNQEIQNLKAKNEAWLVQKEQQKYWNTTPGQMAINSDANQQKVALSAVFKSLGNPVRDSMNDSWKETVQGSTILEDVQDRQKSLAKKMDGNSTEAKEEQIRFNWKLQAEKLRGRIGASYKNITTEANLAVNGKRELASSHNLSELGVTTRVSYRFDTQSTVTSLDKSLSEHVVTRVTHSVGSKPESRAEVIYSQSF